MPNVIALPRGPNVAELMQHAVDQYMTDVARQQQGQARQRELDIQQQGVTQTGAYQQGTLAQAKTALEDKKRGEDVANFIKTAIEPYFNSGRPEDFAIANANMQQALAEHPDWKDEVVGQAMRAKSAPLPADTVNANTNRFAVNQTGIAAGGGTDPNAVNFTTYKGLGAFMPKEGFTQQQATDLASRQPTPTPSKPGPASMKQPIPSPSGNPVADFEARSTGALPTSAENLTSRTQKEVTGMQIASQAPLVAAETRQANAAAMISEGQSKMMGGDPSAVNSFAVGVMLNPKSFESLTTDEKRMAVAGLGGRAPAKLNAQEESAFDAAQNTRDGVTRASTIIDKWAKRGVQIDGPMVGRYNEATNQWGDNILPSSLPPQALAELQGDIAAIQQNFGINKLNELHAVIGGRVPVQMTQIIAAPNIAQNPAMLKGALSAMDEIAAGRINGIERKIWNGTPPQLSGATAAAYSKVATAPAAAAPTAADFLKKHGFQ